MRLPDRPLLEFEGIYPPRITFEYLPNLSLPLFCCYTSKTLSCQQRMIFSSLLLVSIRGKRLEVAKCQKVRCLLQILP